MPATTKTTSPSPVSNPTRRRRRTYCEHDRDRFLTTLRELENILATIKKTGYGPAKCYEWARQAGLAYPRPERPRIPARRATDGRREEFLRLRARGLSRRAACEAVSANRRTAADWDNGIRHVTGKRIYPDGRIIDYKQGVTTRPNADGTIITTPAPGLAALEKPINARYLALTEREHIRDLIATGASLRAIGRILGRNVSTISREISRNSGPDDYQPYTAHRAAAGRRPRPKPGKLTRPGALRRYVGAKLLLGWSPEQISNRLKKLFPDRLELRVCHETIYQAVYVQAKGALKREIVQALRTGRARRKPRRGPGQRTPRFRDPMVNISQRPAEVEDRAVPGHWEGDLITGTFNKSAIGTLVERTTRYVMLIHLDGDHTAERVRDGLITAMSGLPKRLRGSLTWDQGVEMATHRGFTVSTGMDVYFCDPGSPWQRGSNENTNGLLRQYFPKGTDLSVHSQAELDRVSRLLNGRPRKTLDWDTPNERLRGLLLTP